MTSGSAGVATMRDCSVTVSVPSSAGTPRAPSRWTPALLCACLTALGPAPAWAYDFTIDSQTALQVYDVTGPGGAPSLERRRILQTLRLGAYRFLPPGPEAPRLSVVLALRLDSDFGISGLETDPDEARTRFVPGLEAHGIDLTYGWVDGQGLLRGWLDFRVGRQFVVDALGWGAFDGALVRVVTPFWLRIEGWGGLEVQGGLPLSPSTFETDGTQRVSRAGLDPADYPSIEQPGLVPTWGAALESTGMMWAHGRVSYRETQREGRVEERRVGYTVAVTPVEPLTVRGSLVWDLHLGFVPEVTGAAEAQVLRPVVVGLEYVHFVPTFGGDSIWSFFPVEPMNDLRLRTTIDVRDGLQVTAMGFARLFSADEVEGEGGTVTDAGGAATVRGHNRVGEALLRLHGADGFGGLRLGADGWLRRVLWNDRLAASLRASIWRWNDELRARRDGTSFSWVLGGEYRFSRPAKLLVEAEHDVNRVVGHRLRLVALLDLRFEP